MKNILYSLIILTALLSCKSQKKNIDTSTSILSEHQLTTTEYEVVNDFLDAELNSERYKNYINHGITFIKEPLYRAKPIDDYIFSYKQWIPLIKKGRWEDKENMYFIDTLKIKEIKLKIEHHKTHFWKISDFKNFKVQILENEELRKIIRTGSYITLPKQKIIYLSTPLILDDNNAFLSFNIGNGELGFSNINHFTVLLKKINGKWIQTTFYEDGVFY